MLEDRDPKHIYGKKKPLQISNALFAWTLVIILLVGVAIASWFGSFYIFGHPENPSSYKILKKLKKIENPKRFEITDAPRGEFLSAKHLYERYGSMPPRELKKVNNALLRNYLRNYNQTTDLVPYIVGDFNILDSYELTHDDLFSSGVVALAQSKENHKVLIEHIFPTDTQTTHILQRALLTGLDINLERKFDLSAVIHIEKLPSGKILLTAMPIVYGSYTSTEGPGTYSLEPPQDLHLEKPLPLIQSKRLNEATKKYASYLHRMGLDRSIEATAHSSPTPPTNYLVRVERPSAEGTSRPEHPIQPTPTPSTKPLSKKERAKAEKALPAKPVARAEAVDPHRDQIPSHIEQHVERAQPVSESEPHVARAEAVSPDAIAHPQQSIAQQTPILPATPSPAPSLSNIPIPTPAASPDSSLAPPPPLTAISPNSAAISNTASGKWEVYAPGQMPRGRLLDIPDMPTLASKGVAGERIYLQGDFVVTASGANRAVLRSKSAVSNPLGGSTSNIRIIVDYPADSQPPEKGSSFTRDAQRPFMITDVSPPGPDGQINVRVREITK